MARKKKGCSFGKRLRSGKCPSKKQARARKRPAKRYAKTRRYSAHRTRHAYSATTQMMPTLRGRR